jgi:hypothetical protein
MNELIGGPFDGGPFDGGILEEDNPFDSVISFNGKYALYINIKGKFILKGYILDI